jgi:hypothetical protein
MQQVEAKLPDNVATEVERLRNGASVKTVAGPSPGLSAGTITAVHGGVHGASYEMGGLNHPTSGTRGVKTGGTASSTVPHHHSESLPYFPPFGVITVFPTIQRASPLILGSTLADMSSQNYYHAQQYPTEMADRRLPDGIGRGSSGVPQIGSTFRGSKIKAAFGDDGDLVDGGLGAKKYRRI